MSAKIKVLACCTTRLLAEGVKSSLDGESDIAVSCACSGQPLTAAIIHNVDVILSDLDYFIDYTELLLTNKRSRILLLYNTKRSEYMTARISELVYKGLAGILTPESDAALLIKAIRKIHAGELWLNRQALKDILCQNAREKVSLTRQEKTIGACVARAMRNKEIAERLGISEQTVKSHCNRIYKKLGITDRLQLAMYWQKEGLDYGDADRGSPRGD